jgi:hypothetical protein
MAIGNLYVRSADGRVEAYWTGGAGTGTLEYSLDSGGLSGWTVASSSITGTDNHYAHTLANSTTARWWRYSEGGAPITFADAAYAHSGTFRDPDGWSVVPLGVGKSCIFVASAGSTPAGNDANSGATPNLPKLTISNAIGSSAAGDHILALRGATFPITASITPPANGSSSIAVSMISSYGPVSTAKPIVDFTTVGTGFPAFDIERGGGAALNHLAFTSIHFYQGTRVDNNQTPFFFYANADCDDLLYEDISAENCAGGLIVQPADPHMATHVVIRRNVLWDGHSCVVGQEQDQAVFVDRTSGLIFEDNILVNNGYYLTPSDLKSRSHNVYISEHNESVSSSNIITVGADNQTRCGGTWQRWLVVQSNLGMTAGGLGWNGTATYSQDQMIRDCILDGSRDRDSPQGWGFWTGDGCNGLSGSTATITIKDCLINLSSLDGGTTVGTSQIPIHRWGTLNTETLVVDGCVIPRSTTASSDYGIIHLENSPGTFRVVRTTIDVINSRAILSEASGTHPTWQFGDNRYYTARADVTGYGGWFINQSGVTGRTFAEWQTYAGDPTSGTSASQKLGAAPTFTSQRRVTDYADYRGVNGGSSNTVATFSTALKAQRKGAWDVNLTAEYAIDWIRQGYGMPALLGPAAPTIDSTSATSTSITVNWTDVSASAVSGEYRLDGGAAVAMPDIDGSFTIGGLTPSTSYGIEIRINDGASDSGWSGVATQATAAIVPRMSGYAPNSFVMLLLGSGRK